jgi:hypothetical protein
MSDRQQSVTHQVKSRYGSHYIHVDHIAGRVTGIAISSPGKFASTALADMLGDIAAAANAIIDDIGELGGSAGGR